MIGLPVGTCIYGFLDGKGDVIIFPAHPKRQSALHNNILSHGVRPRTFLGKNHVCDQLNVHCKYYCK
jgi:hypothetical protein